MNSIVIFGGAGFVGRHIIRRLSLKGYKIYVPYQRPTNEAKLRLLGNFGQVIPFHYSTLDDQRIANILNKSNVCINLKTNWISKKLDFNQTIFKFNEKLLNLIDMKKSVEQFIYFSGLGIDEDKKSLRSVAVFKSEKIISSRFNNSIIIRPGIIIGKDDNFLSHLIPIFKMSFVIPIFGNGKSVLQPIYIEDVALTVEKIIHNKLHGKHIFELVGPYQFSYNDLFNLIKNIQNKKRILFNVPMIIAKFLVNILQKTPFSPINLEQLRLFEKDSIQRDVDKDLNFFNINPKDTIEIIRKIAKF